MKKGLVAALGIAAFGLSTLSAGGQDRLAPSGATLVATCTGCHGPAGQSAGAIPALNGRTEADILQAMLEFKSDRRPATVMNRHAKGFSDEEIALMAREIAASWR